MSFSIPLTGLSASDVVPGNYFEINFAAGPASSGSLTYPVLILANKTSAGDATVDTVIYGPDTPVTITNETELIARAGTGSEAHRMGRRFWKVNKDTPLYFLFVTESVGAAATGTITVATTATGGATYRVFVGDDFCDTDIANTDTAAAIATAAITSINAKTEWPVTAGSGGAGVITLTAKQKGVRGNTIRYGSQIIAPASIATTSTPTAQTAMTGGTTADVWTTALATINPLRFYYIVPAADDQTTIALVKAQVNTQATPTTGILQRVVAGSVDTPANANTLAIALNSARSELVAQYLSDWTPGELAANAAAIYALEESPLVPRFNFNSYGEDEATSQRWFVPVPRSASAALTRTQIKSALNNGVTPIAMRGTRSTYLVKRITTRSLNGSTADYRIRDAHKVTECDLFVDKCKVKYAARFSGKLIGDDPQQGQKRLGANVVTPSVLKSVIVEQIREDAALDLLQDEQATIDNTVTNREPAPRTRLSARVPLNPRDILDQTTTAVDQQ